VGKNTGSGGGRHLPGRDPATGAHMKLKYGTVVNAKPKSQVTLAPMPHSMAQELDDLGVRSLARPPRQEKREPPADVGWSIRGDECPH
jgi:hypothetical protein